MLSDALMTSACGAGIMRQSRTRNAHGYRLSGKGVARPSTKWQQPHYSSSEVPHHLTVLLTGNDAWPLQSCPTVSP